MMAFARGYEWIEASNKIAELGWPWLALVVSFCGVIDSVFHQHEGVRPGSEL